MTPAAWISLGGVAASLLTPGVIAFFGFVLNKRLKHFERSLEDQRRVTETRFELYKDIGFQLNDIYAYYMFVGNWKDHSPAQIVEHKRRLDRHIFTYRPLFSDEFNASYDKFILECFAMHGGWRKDARLRTVSRHRAEDGDEEWATCFTQEDNKKAIKQAHRALLDRLAIDLGMKQGASSR